VTKIRTLTPRPSVDWEAGERLYTTTLMSVRDIAATLGTKPSTVQSRARAGRWVRGAQATKRQIVADAQAGVLPGMKPDEAKRSQEKAIAEDLEDMKTGLTGYRRLLKVMQQAADQLKMDDPMAEKKAKTMAETIDKAVDGIRKIRGLDDPSKKALPQDELNELIALLADQLGPDQRPDPISETAGR
jgi:predicted transcriptional regulator